MRFWQKIGFFCVSVMATCLCACSSHTLDEAHGIVAQADSLWRIGQSYEDSARLAAAYKTFSSRHYLHAEDYAHACYHYGRLLRAKENPAAAMQVFIDATHSRTNDYHILGRVYSNMGSICHLANEFSLSYDMYAKSAESFLKNGDTINYHYALNDMALELAEQGKKEETLNLLSKIERQCSNKNVLGKVYETKAVLYQQTEQYDSAIYCANHSIHLCYIGSIVLLVKAQAYDDLNKKDSALLYAHRVMSDKYSSAQDRFNALYIIKHCDSTLLAEEIDSLFTQREDIRYYEYEPLKEKTHIAVQLLELDLRRKPDWRWLYAIIGTITITGTSLYIYVFRKQKRHQLLSQQIEELTTINSVAMHQHERMMQEHTDYTNKLTAQSEQNSYLFAQSEDFPDNLYWKDFDAMCKLINHYFGMLATKLQSIYHLSEKEVRLCILVLMKITEGKQLAHLLFYSERGIRTFKNRTAKKLGTNSIELRNFLIHLSINDVPSKTDSAFVYGTKKDSN